MRRRLGLALITLGVAFAIAVAGLRLYYEPRLRLRHVAGFGNFAADIAALPPPAASGSLRFVVLGDSSGYRTIYQRLLRMARDAGAAFVVNTGDIVKFPNEESFALASFDHAEVAAESPPVRFAIGNHDKPPLDWFRACYGPEQFSFVHGDCLFVFADNNDDQHTSVRADGCLAFIRAEIARHRGRARHVFLVFHHPIIGYYKRDAAAGTEAWYALLDEEKIDAVFMGHFHGYERQMHKDTLLLVSGGAGSRLHQNQTGFHHLVVVDVTPEGIRDTLVKLEERTPLLDIGRVYLLQAYPWLCARWWQLLLSMVGAGASVVGGSRLRRRRSSAATESTDPDAGATRIRA